MRSFTAHCVTFIFTILLAACGGGGGGSSGSGASNNPPPSTPPPPATAERVPINAGNYESLGAIADFHMENVQILGESAISTVFTILLSNDPIVVIDCDAGGNQVFTHMDTNGDGDINAGEIITVNITNCSFQGDDEFNASIIVEVSEIDVISNPQTLKVKLQITDSLFQVPGGSLEIETTMEVNWSFDGTSESLVMTGDLMDVHVDQFHDELRNFVFREDFEYGVTDRYEIRMSGEVITLDTLESYLVTTIRPLAGIVGEYPESGEIKLTGALASSVVFKNGGGTPPPGHGSTMLSEVDENGDGIIDFQVEGKWSDVFFGFLFNVDPNAPPPDPPTTDLSARVIELGDLAFEMDYDIARSRVYVSVPKRNEIVVIDAATYHVIDRVLIGSVPYGISVSKDNSTLFVALGGGGAVSMLDLETHEITDIETAVTMKNHETFDVVETVPNLLFVTGSVSGFAHAVRVDGNQGNEQRVVADNRILASPRLLASQDDRHVYIAESAFSSGTIYKLDATDADAPIILQNAGLTIGAEKLALDPADTRLIVGSGQVLETATFNEETRIDAGAPAYSLDGSQVAVATFDGLLKFLDSATFEEIATYTTDCPSTQFLQLMQVNALQEWLILAGDKLCVVSLSSPNDPPGSPGDPGVPPDLPVVDIAAIDQGLGGIGFDVEVDASRNLIYVSVPAQDEIVVLSAADASIVNTISILMPRGLAMSPDGSSLYVAKNNSADLAVIDLDSMSISENISIQAELGSDEGWDVAVSPDDKVYVTANPIGYVVEIDRNAGNAVQRIADGQLIRKSPELAISSDGQFLYVGTSSGGVPNTIYKLDLNQPMAPVVLIDGDSRVKGATRLSVDATGDIIFTDGQALRTSTFYQRGDLEFGVPAAGLSPDSVFIGIDGAVIHEVNTSSWLPVNKYQTDCAIDEVSRLKMMSDEQKWIMLGEDIVCLVTLPD